MLKIAICLVAVLVGACSRDRVRAPQEQGSAYDVDTLYTNGTIWIGADAPADANVFAVKDGHITFVGDAIPDDLTAEKIVDLENRFTMAGFIDNHVHFFDGGAGLASVDLRDASTPEEFSKRIIAHAATLEDGRWILIGNWDHENWGGELPKKDWIDKETLTTPVFVLRLDGHMALANSAALELAGIDHTTETPQGGEIVRDENGDPTGILKDAAMNAVFKVIPEPTERERSEIFDLAQAHALSLGVTQIHNLIGYPHETKMLDQLRQIEARGEMKIRVHMYSPIEDWQSTAALIGAEGRGDDRLRWGGQKAFVDGSLGATTAWFHEPYEDQRTTSGFPLVDPVALQKMMRDADAAGLPIAVHAIGDRAIDQVIADMRAIAGEEIAARRFRIEHFQHPGPGAIAALAESKIIAAVHPYHAIDDGRWAEDRLGADRIKTTYAFKSVLDAGGILSFGSDWPVAPLSPLDGIYAAVTRATTDGKNPDGWLPQEKISVEEALRAYTQTNAYVGFEEPVAGTLSVGKRADFIILSEDPRAVEAARIKDIDVLATFISGEEVFRMQK